MLTSRFREDIGLIKTAEEQAIRTEFPQRLGFCFAPYHAGDRACCNSVVLRS